MTVYTPKPQDWHADLPGECTCDEVYAGRGMVDDRCYWHRLIEAVEDLREAGWQVAKGEAA